MKRRVAVEVLSIHISSVVYEHIEQLHLASFTYLYRTEYPPVLINDPREQTLIVKR